LLQDTSDIRHLGTRFKVSNGHIGTGVEVSEQGSKYLLGQFGTGASFDSRGHYSLSIAGVSLKVSSAVHQAHRLIQLDRVSQINDKILK